jgi:hypothetical protein
MNDLKNIKSILEYLELPGKHGRKVDSWINVKIDKDLDLRISRYTYAMDKYAKPISLIQQNDIFELLKKKFNILSNPTSNQYGAQCKLSIILILQYLKEIRSNFDPSSSGFLFEDFIAGLLHSKKVGDNKNSYFTDINDKTYQIKFYKGSSYQIKINPDLCDYYIVGLKSQYEVRIWSILWDQESPDGNGTYVYGPDKLGKYHIDMTRIRNNENPEILSFKNIDNNIRTLSQNLRDFIEQLYDEISELNYNIETIITGVNKENIVLKDIKEIDSYYMKSQTNISNIGQKVKDVTKEVERSIKKY